MTNVDPPLYNPIKQNKNKRNIRPIRCSCICQFTSVMSLKTNPCKRVRKGFGEGHSFLVWIERRTLQSSQRNPESFIDTGNKTVVDKTCETLN